MVASVVALSLIPLDGVDLSGGRDKLSHSLAYASLSFWFGMLFAGRRRQLGIAIAFAAMGAGLEFLQGLTDYRSFEVADMIANLTGAVVGWGLTQTPLKHTLGWLEHRISAATRQSRR